MILCRYFYCGLGRHNMFRKNLGTVLSKFLFSSLVVCEHQCCVFALVKFSLVSSFLFHCTLYWAVFSHNILQRIARYIVLLFTASIFTLGQTDKRTDRGINGRTGRPTYISTDRPIATFRRKSNITTLVLS